MHKAAIAVRFACKRKPHASNSLEIIRLVGGRASTVQLLKSAKAKCRMAGHIVYTMLRMSRCGANGDRRKDKRGQYCLAPGFLLAIKFWKFPLMISFWARGDFHEGIEVVEA